MQTFGIYDVTFEAEDGDGSTKDFTRRLTSITSRKLVLSVGTLEDDGIYLKHDDQYGGYLLTGQGLVGVPTVKGIRQGGKSYYAKVRVADIKQISGLEDDDDREMMADIEKEYAPEVA